MMHRLRRYDVFRFAQNDVAPLRSAMMRCLPICARRHASLGEAVIIGAAVIICRRQTSFKKRTFVGRQKCVFCWWTRGESLLHFFKHPIPFLALCLKKCFGHRFKNSPPDCFFHCVRLPLNSGDQKKKPPCGGFFFWWTRGESNPCPKTR